MVERPPPHVCTFQLVSIYVKNRLTFLRATVGKGVACVGSSKSGGKLLAKRSKTACHRREEEECIIHHVIHAYSNTVHVVIASAVVAHSLSDGVQLLLHLQSATVTAGILAAGRTAHCTHAHHVRTEFLHCALLFTLHSPSQRHTSNGFFTGRPHDREQSDTVYYEIPCYRGNGRR